MKALRWALPPFAGLAGGALAVLQGGAGALAAGGLALALLGVFAPPLSLALYACGNSLAVRGLPVGGLSVAPETLFLLWLLLVGLLRAGGEPGTAALRSARAPATFALAFAAVALVSALRGGIDAREARILLHAPVWIANAAAVPLLCRTRRAVLTVLAALVVGASALGLLSLLEPRFFTNAQEGIFLSDYRNPFAHLLGLSLVLSASLYLLGEAPGRWLAACSSLLLFAAIVATGSRGGWAAAGAGLLAVLASRARSLAPRGTLCGAVAASLLASTVALSAAPVHEGAERAADRFRTIFDWHRRSSNRYRQQVALASLRIAEERPLLGAGPGRFRQEADRRREGLDALRRGVSSTDNEYARTLGELGLVGLSLLVFAGLATARRLRRSLARAARPVEALLPALGVGLLAHTAALAVFEDLAYASALWFALGIAWRCGAEETPT
ncbi:MAG TPA: O-antigen ligase family protein [Planctomycetota bacterium]|jgi:O-antigen ligase|nr:O-antigen ligase family protein [Planctomycetota bacterium]